MIALKAVAATPAVIADVRAAVDKGDFARAERVLAAYRTKPNPEVIEAVSWMGRGALAAHKLNEADAYADRTLALVTTELKSRRLDAEGHLPIALGAAIEVKAQVLNERGQRADAVAFLRRELVAYRTTSIRARIQKNLNLLTIEGKPAPALDERQWLGPKPQPLSALKGHPVLLFFWAHWCGDCKLQRRELSQIKREFPSLVLIGPTQMYGYVAGGVEAPPDRELKYLDEIRNKYYADLLDMPVPISGETFKLYGASTTPTLVFIDRAGIVRAYHPGRMTLDELRAAVRETCHCDV